MTDYSGVEAFAVLILVALAPALIYLAWVRKTERYMTEGWRPILNAFFYGALGATAIAALIEGILLGLGTSFSQAYPGPDTAILDSSTTIGALFLVLVIAPFVEEAVKVWGVIGSSDQFRLVADGPVFGASVGLGFGFFETFLYGFSGFLIGGLALGLEIILIRSLSSVLMHGSTTAVFGYGQAMKVFTNGQTKTGGYYLTAVAMHSLFNLIASLPAIFVLVGITTGIYDYATYISLALAMAFSFLAIEYARVLIHRSDVPPDTFVHAKYKAPTVAPKAPRAPPARESP